VSVAGGLGGEAEAGFAIPPGTAPGTASTVTVSAVSQADPADADADTFLVVAALPVDLALGMAGDPGEAELGDPIRYTLVISNSGPNPSGRVVVTDLLPVELELVTATASQGACTEQEGTIVCELEALGAGAVATVTLETKVVALDEERRIVNIAWANVPAAAEFDPDPYDNTATVEVGQLAGGRVYLPVVMRGR
jgi:uncharacterized repeat protein (TIGR01451 family)